MNDDDQIPTGAPDPKVDPDFERAMRDSSPLDRIPRWAIITVALLVVFVLSMSYLKNSLNQTAPTNDTATTDLDESQSQDRGPAREGSFATLDGKPAALADFRGKVAVVTFWASWCTPCIVELPTFGKLKTEFGDKGLEILAINLDDEEPSAREFIAENWNPQKLPFSSYFDPRREMMKNFNVETIPSTFVLDRKGRVAMSAIGSQDWSDARVLDGIRQIVNEK